MPKHSEIYSSTYTTTQLFDIVADIEQYPQFLPWVTKVHIFKKTEEEIIAELTVRFKAIVSKYTSQVTLKRPNGADDLGLISVRQSSGPFHHLVNNWRFIPLANKSSEIHFDIDFAFKSRILDKIIGAVFSHAAREMALAFEKRAKELYG